MGTATSRSRCCARARSGSRCQARPDVRDQYQRSMCARNRRRSHPCLGLRRAARGSRWNRR